MHHYISRKLNGSIWRSLLGRDLKIQRLFYENKPQGVFISNALNPQEQEVMYYYTLDLSREAINKQFIDKMPKKFSVPLTYYNLVYTQTSNSRYPKHWMNFANILWQKVFLEPPKHKFNSLYAQLFHHDSTMKIHCDEHVDVGVSISLGSSCNFTFGDTSLLLPSGSVVIADFSKVPHGVTLVDKNIPEYLRHLEWFDRSRCSIQIRRIEAQTSPIMKMEEFNNYIQA